MHHLASIARPTPGVLALLGVAAFAPARADDTILRLSESATVMVVPDELTASMRAETVAPSAPEAQKRVNEMLRDALATAKKIDDRRTWE